MANCVELLGQKEVQLAEAYEQYSALWHVLRRLKEGELCLDEVTVSTQPDGRQAWKIEPKAADGADFTAQTMDNA